VAFNIRESYWGLEHVKLRLWRQLFKISPDHFMSKYMSSGIPMRASQQPNGAGQTCERCGFDLLEADFDGWKVQMCSALPVAHLDSPEFQQWLAALANRDCQLHRPEPILHE